MHKPPVICLMGPTASGKTDLAVKLVADFPMEIISVDSAMVYRGMDIGTAKPSQEILNHAPHRLIDIRNPDETYSAAEFCTDAVSAIKEIIANKKIPLLVGGTMMYFRALQTGLSDLPSANAELRKAITAEAENIGWPAMHDKLKLIDKNAAARIHPHDSQRIQRAIEVHELAGKNLTSCQVDRANLLLEYNVVNLAVAPANRSVLHERIEHRFKEMIVLGFIDEVIALLQSYPHLAEAPAMRSVGYRQVLAYLNNNLTYEEMILRGVIATRQLAKRQLTWLRTWPDVNWFDSENKEIYSQINAAMRKIINETI